MLADWKPEYETGHSQIDSEHQELVALIEGLAEAISQKASSEDLKLLLDKTIAHTREHFQAEENLVRNRSYRRFDIHCAGHDNVLYSLSKIAKKFSQDPSYLTLEIVQSIKDAVIKHIVEDDLPMVESLKLQQSPSLAI